MIFVQVGNRPVLYPDSVLGTRGADNTCVAVEPDRREWGAWNFVAFWIADSANIVRVLLLQSRQPL